MALHTVAVPSDPAQDHNTYSGTLIRDLMELVDEVEQKHSTPADDDDDSVEPGHSSASLTIDDVLERSRYFESQNPYVRLLERVLA